jgi:hypothetical protein
MLCCQKKVLFSAPLNISDFFLGSMELHKYKWTYDLVSKVFSRCAVTDCLVCSETCFSSEIFIRKRVWKDSKDVYNRHIEAVGVVA